jgi:hypothetical protein
VLLLLLLCCSWNFSMACMIAAHRPKARQGSPAEQQSWVCCAVGCLVLR